MRAPTAYFLFAGEIRADIQAEIAAENDGKVSVAAIGKAIGARWQLLSDEERQQYKDKAKELKEQQQAEEAIDDENNNNPDNADNQTTSQAPPLPPFGLPTSLVKKIACMDPDVSRMSGDAAKAISKASALFIQFFATKALQHASEQKRKNFKFSDLDAVAHRDRRLVDMGLNQFLREDHAFRDIHDRIDAENQNRAGGKKTAAEIEEAQKKQKIKPLTDFFQQNHDVPEEETAA